MFREKDQILHPPIAETFPCFDTIEHLTPPFLLIIGGKPEDNNNQDSQLLTLMTSKFSEAN